MLPVDTLTRGTVGKSIQFIDGPLLDVYLDFCPGWRSSPFLSSSDWFCVRFGRHFVFLCAWQLNSKVAPLAACQALR
jgi:hypothetical protein